MPNATVQRSGNNFDVRNNDGRNAVGGLVKNLYLQYILYYLIKVRARLYSTPAIYLYRFLLSRAYVPAHGQIVLAAGHDQSRVLVESHTRDAARMASQSTQRLRGRHVPVDDALVEAGRDDVTAVAAARGVGHLVRVSAVHLEHKAAERIP